LPVLVGATVLLGSIASVRAGWNLVWSDEFDSNAIDTSKWIFDIGNGQGGWGNRELEYYTGRAQNAFVSNGLLHIVAVKEPFNGFRFTSAKLKSSHLFFRKFGRFEFRAKLPQGKGYWPALWMMPEESRYGGWPASGEIDVMENRGSNITSVLGTIHFGGLYPEHDQSHGLPFIFEGGDTVTNFHVYAVEWTTNSISWYVDNHLYETQTSWWSSSNRTNSTIRNTYPAPFDRPFYIIMNLAVGGKFGGNPDHTTAFPGEMQVDYVRAYDWVDGPHHSLTVESSPPSDTAGPLEHSERGKSR
jgi:beta-glucanase (GH16 family)